MDLAAFMRVAERVTHSDQELAGFARLAVLYEEARQRGAPGLKQEDVSEGDVEFLIQLGSMTVDGFYAFPELDPGYKTPRKAAIESLFEQFWALYPRKVAKLDARKAWVARVRNEAVARQVIAAVKKHYEADWIGREQAFIPHAATWIRQERWTDELEEPEGGMSGVL